MKVWVLHTWHRCLTIRTRRSRFNSGQISPWGQNGRSMLTRRSVKAGHVGIPTKWVLTDKTEHLKGTPEYVPKRRRVWSHVGVVNTSAQNKTDAQTADSPTADPEGIASAVLSLGLRLRAADATNAYGKPLALQPRCTGPRDPAHRVCDCPCPSYGTTGASRNLYLRIMRAARSSACVRRRSCQLCISLQMEVNNSALLCARTSTIPFGAPLAPASKPSSSSSTASRSVAQITRSIPPLPG